MNLTQAQREAVEQAAAACFEKSEDICTATGLMVGVLERMLERRAKCPVCGFTPCKLSHQEASDGPAK